MSDRAFLDTNIFVYAYDNSSPVKKSIARELIRTSLLDRNAVVSYQVVQEFFNVVLKQNSIKMRPEEAQQLLETLFRPLLSVPSSIPLFDAAIHLQSRSRQPVLARQHHAIVRGEIDVLFAQTISPWRATRRRTGVSHQHRALYALGAQRNF